jgi:protein gp37
MAWDPDCSDFIKQLTEKIMKDSKIEWTDHTFNPWWGCTKVSPGCANCYADTWARRLGKKLWGKGVPRERRGAAYWRNPLKWNRKVSMRCSVCGATGTGTLLGERCNFCADESKSGVFELAEPRPRVFCASMADWLDDEVPIEWLADLLELIHDTPNLDWLLLTKRPENFEKRLSGAFWYAHGRNNPSLTQFISEWNSGVERKNIWIGTTVENQEMANKRIPELLDIPAKVRFLSCEPLLEAVKLDCLELEDNATLNALTGDWGIDGRGHTGPRNERVHWVICGGESGHHAQPMQPEWARSLRDQCTEAEVPFFFKQWGNFGPEYAIINDGSPAHQTYYNNAEYVLCEQGERIYRVGKDRLKPLLDGVEYKELPV